MSATVLTGGIDTLYWSTACGIAEERFAALRLARSAGLLHRLEKPAWGLAFSR